MKNSAAGERLKAVFLENWGETFLWDGMGGNAFSYREFFGITLGLKEKLTRLGVRPGDKICLLMHNSAELAAFYFAALVMQATIVPIEPAKGGKEIREILSQLDYRLLICDVPGFDSVKGSVPLGRLGGIASWQRGATAAELGVFGSLDYDALYLVTFTSGSTGAPKGVMHSFNNLFSSAMAFRKRFGFGKENVFYHNLPMSYMAGILNLLVLPFVSGSRVVLGERFGASAIARFWDIPIKYSVNTFWFTPTVLSLLLKLDRGERGVEYAAGNKLLGCVGTAPLNSRTKAAFEEKYGLPLYESYGLSETLFVATNSPGRPEREHSVGELLDGALISFSSDGEIRISVPWMFLGYTNSSTESYFQGREYLSGDIGEMDGDGFLRITGRKKDLIIRGGVNISPRRIKDFIDKSDIFEDSAVLGFEDATMGERTVCFFVPVAGRYSEERRKVLGRAITSELGKDYQVDEFVELKEIPKNVNGKVDKPALRKMLPGGRE